MKKEFKLARLIALLLVCSLLLTGVFIVQAAEGDAEDPAGPENPPAAELTELEVWLDDVRLGDTKVGDPNPSFVYNGTEHSVVVKNGTEVFTEGISILYKVYGGQNQYSNTKPKNVGTYQVLVKLTQSAEAGFQYTLHGYAGTMDTEIAPEYFIDIIPCPVTINITDNQQLTYTGAPLEPVISASAGGPGLEALGGVESLFDVEYNLDIDTPAEERVTHTDVGSYRVNYTLKNEDNFTLTEGSNSSASFNINKKPISFAVENQELEWGFPNGATEHYEIALPSISDIDGVAESDVEDLEIHVNYYDINSTPERGDWYVNIPGVFNAAFTLAGDRADQYELSANTARLSVALGEGRVHLTKRTAYALKSGSSWKVKRDTAAPSDDIIYPGGNVFYVPETDWYTFTRAN